MNTKQARELLAEEGKNLSDKQVLKSIETAEFFANLLINKIKNLSPEEREKLLKQI